MRERALSGEASRREKRGRARRTKKKETAGSLMDNVLDLHVQYTD